MPMLWANVWALVGLSPTSSPRKDTPFLAYFSDSTASVGASPRHGPHQDPQKFSTTTFPLYEEDFSAVPVIEVPEKAGAAGRWPLSYSQALVLPPTYCRPLACPLPPESVTV